MRNAVPALCLLCLSQEFARAEVVLENKHFRFAMSDEGRGKSLLDKATGQEYGVGQPGLPAFTVYAQGKGHPCSKVEQQGDALQVSFADIDTVTQLRLRRNDYYVALTLGKLTGTPVDRLDLLALRLKPMPKLGPWINVAYDDGFGVCLFGGGPNVNASLVRPKADQPWVDLTAIAYRETGLEGATAILLCCPVPEKELLTYMQVAEADFGLPSGAKGRKSEAIKYSYLWVSPTTQNIDELIQWAKRGGFRMMLYSYGSFSKSCGHYEWNNAFPNGMADLKIIADKIRRAGLTVGLHLHFNKAHKSDPYVTPVPDDRLHIVQHFTLSAPVDDRATALSVNENPKGCTLDSERRLLKVGKEIVEYTDFKTEQPFEFRGCKRGALGTRITAHAAGNKLGLLDVDTWPIFIRFDQKTDIQEETAERLARIVTETGPYDMVYFDGSEDVHEPFWYHCANAQWRVYKGLRPEPVVCEAAATTHFSWHMMTRSNAYDSVAPSEMKDFCCKNPARFAPARALDFTKINFGWLHGFGSARASIEPDTLEFVLSRGAAWDCPFSMAVSLDQIASNPRSEDCFDVTRIWEDARIDGKLTPAEKTALKNLDQEHHLFINEKGAYELVPVIRLEEVAGGQAITAYLFTRESEPGATYVLMWHKTDACELTLDFPSVRLTLMRPFGKTLQLSGDATRSTVPVETRCYLRFGGTKSEEVAEILKRAKASGGAYIQLWLKASGFVRKEGQMALGSEIGLKPEGSLADVIVPTGPGSMTGDEVSFVEYAVDLPSKGRWHVWGRCWYNDTSSNSFFVSAPGVDDKKQLFGNSYVWKQWLWESGGAFKLDKGRATVSITVRESLPKISPLLDVLCLTNDPGFQPTDEAAARAIAAGTAR